MKATDTPKPRATVSAGEIQSTKLAYELAVEVAARTGSFNWPRCIRNARDRLSRAARKR